MIKPALSASFLRYPPRFGAIPDARSDASSDARPDPRPDARSGDRPCYFCMKIYRFKVIYLGRYID